MKMYYIEYNFEYQDEVTMYQLYVVDTGFGVLELGSIGEGTIYDNDVHFSEGYSLQKYLLRHMSDRDHVIVRVL